MQDALSMAEGMRLPFVSIIGMRGGPSSGTVIYSQQEVTLACYGGNGEGLRLVYSPSNLEELYNFTVKAFQDAWKYKLPAIVLTDGYLLKTKGIFENKTKIKKLKTSALVKSGSDTHLPSIYTLEEDLYQKLLKDKKDYDKIANKIVDSENYKTDDTDILLIAHGIVGASAKQAVEELQEQGKKVGLFRPITLRPFPSKDLNDIAGKVKKIVVIESSLGQLERIVKSELDPKISIEIESLQYPALGIEPEMIIKELQ
jgi:2-oxoglutarate/2-oxoacid ferredoxin oxidoreductase subunit alpha